MQDDLIQNNARLYHIIIDTFIKKKYIPKTVNKEQFANTLKKYFKNDNSQILVLEWGLDLKKNQKIKVITLLDFEKTIEFNNLKHKIYDIDEYTDLKFNDCHQTNEFYYEIDENNLFFKGT